MDYCSKHILVAIEPWSSNSILLSYFLFLRTCNSYFPTNLWVLNNKKIWRAQARDPWYSILLYYVKGYNIKVLIVSLALLCPWLFTSLITSVEQKRHHIYVICSSFFLYKPKLCVEKDHWSSVLSNSTLWIWRRHQKNNTLWRPSSGLLGTHLASLQGN